jgi:hypothetical protein
MRIAEILDKCELERLSDTSWGYTYSTQNFILHFYQTDVGVNILEEYTKKIKGLWVDLIATDEEIKLMWDKLNNTQYHDDSEPFSDEEEITDPYAYFGVPRENFY